MQYAGKELYLAPDFFPPSHSVFPFSVLLSNPTMSFGKHEFRQKCSSFNDAMPPIRYARLNISLGIAKNKLKAPAASGTVCRSFEDGKLFEKFSTFRRIT